MQHRAARLRDDGARLLTAVVSDTGGVIRSKSVPAARMEVFATAGMGASITWPVFCVDNAVAMTEDVGVVGDLRLRADLAAAVLLDRGYVWSPADVLEQSGHVSPYCWRDALRRQATRCTEAGFEILVGAELEFTLIDEDDRPLGHRHGWPCYGSGVFSELSDFAASACERLDEAGIEVEQIHAEYGMGQFEISLSPQSPISIADHALLARAVIARTSRDYGLRVSFAPMPFADGAGNGAHLHVSMRDSTGASIFSGGDGPAGLTGHGAHAIAGLVTHLPETMAVLAGTVVSAERMQPGHWAGAFSCWGVENREAAIRLIANTPGNPRGANIEIKSVDGGANPYLALALIIGMALQGIEQGLPLPDETRTDPAALTEAEVLRCGVTAMNIDAKQRITLFAESDIAREILGAELHAAVIAVRQRELNAFDTAEPHQFVRYAWTG